MPKMKQKIEIEKTHLDPLLPTFQAVTTNCTDFLGTVLITNYYFPITIFAFLAPSFH